MKYNDFFKAIAATLLVVPLFVACSDDNDDSSDSPEESPEVETVTKFDDLSFFQGAFVDAQVAKEATEAYEVGETISFAFLVGEPIYENDETNLYIGVANLEEALAFWDACLAPDIVRTTSAANNYTYTLTDKEGKTQGTVSFSSGGEGIVAQITTNLPELQYFDKVRFILNSAWEAHNGPTTEARYHVGDIRYFDVPEVGATPFVCVRERSNGVKPLYVGITKKTYYAATHPNDFLDNLINSKWCPREAKAKTIYEVLHTDWDFFVAVFDEAGGGKLDEDKPCWIDKYEDYYPVPLSYLSTINLIDGTIDRWNTYWYRPHKPALLKVDWLDEDAFFYIPGLNSGGYSCEEPDNIFDGQKGTKWCAGPSYKTGTSIGISGKKCWFIEFETREAVAPVGYEFVSANDTKKYKERNPKEWVLLGKKSVYDSEWTVLDKRSNDNIATSNNKATSFRFSNNIGKDWRYFRFEVTENQNPEKALMLGGFKFINE